MMVLIRSLPWDRRLANRRGAAFLLSVYFVSLTLLVLGSIALQRTIFESRAAQISRDSAQAFYLAEGALDAAFHLVARYNLLDGVCYTTTLSTADDSPARCPPGQDVDDSFMLQTIAGEIPQAGRQRLTRKIIATGQRGLHGQRVRRSVSAYIEESGPIMGVWGRGVVDVHGGKSALAQFVMGSMRSNTGAMTSDANLGLLDIDGAAYFDNPVVMDSGISAELQSVKNGYKCLELNKCVGPLSLDLGYFLGTGPMGWAFTMPAMGSLYGEDHVDMRFSPSDEPLPVPYQESIPAATGALTLGVIKEPIASLTMAPGTCKDDLVLKAGTVTKVGYDTAGLPGVTAVIGDLLWMCVNSITPDTDEAWLNTLTSSPPELVFERPTILVVTGTKPYDLENSSQMVYSKAYGKSFPVQTALPYAGVQYDWHVAVAAKISAPKGLFLVVADQPAPAANRKPVVWIKPGPDFDVGVHAPQSLVVVRERDSKDKRYKNEKIVPYRFRGVVGDEVIVELNNDAVEIGVGKKDPAQCTTKFLGWANSDGS